MPHTEEYHKLVKELFGENLGENAMINAPIFVNLANRVKIGKNAVLMNGFQCMSASGLTIEDDTKIALN